MSTPTLPHTDLFAALDSALIAVEFADITGAHGVHAAAKREADTAAAVALARGYILDPINCCLGDEVQNLHGDTGSIIEMCTSDATPHIEVRWDAPSTHPTTFTTPNLLAGHLRHRR
jgi:hypothetical protein